MAGSGNSKEDIVSMGLIAIGEAPISSFSEGTAGLVASNIYDTQRDTMLTDYRWRFATGKVGLARLTATPLNEWQYAFQLPTNLLLLIRTYPNSNYEIFEGQLYSNNSTCQIDHVYRPESGEFPAYFVKALASRMAAEMAIAITNNQSLAELMDAKAQRDLRAARFKDSQGRPNDSIVSKPWVQARRGG